MTKTISSHHKLSSGVGNNPDFICNHHQRDKPEKIIGNTVSDIKSQYLQCGFKVVHTTKNRVRIRATDGSHQLIIKNICQDLQNLSGIKKIDFHPSTNSLVILFDEDQLSLVDLLLSLAEFGIQEEKSQLEENQDVFAPWKSRDFWQEQIISLIPLFTGLGVTGALGVTGLRSIALYMLTADTTRRAIAYLQNHLPQTSENTEKKSEESLNCIKCEVVIDYHIVHQVPGRIRFKIPKIAEDRAYARRLERLLKTDGDCTSVRVNSNAASVAIAYEDINIPVTHWINLILLADGANLSTNPPARVEVSPYEQREIFGDESAVVGASNAVELVDNKNLQQCTSLENYPETTSLAAMGLWTDFKSPALTTALNWMAKFPLDVS